ncbi:MAG: nucleotidyltransferase domain-containing protein [Spirochaetales bacterium]|nr:nucleotidyltransferase domain-containing protein [Spirochaetales bacterium]
MQPETLNLIKTILTTEKKIEKAVLFGSRAKGTEKKGSDIDIALFGENLDLKSVGLLSQQFEESTLSWKVDLVLVEMIDNSNLLDHIQRLGQGIYEQENAPRELC